MLPLRFCITSNLLQALVYSSLHLLILNSRPSMMQIGLHVLIQENQSLVFAYFLVILWCLGNPRSIKPSLGPLLRQSTGPWVLHVVKLCGLNLCSVICRFPFHNQLCCIVILKLLCILLQTLYFMSEPSISILIAIWFMIKFKKGKLEHSMSKQNISWQISSPNRLVLLLFLQLFPR
jgi:hypothetical protein